MKKFWTLLAGLSLLGVMVAAPASARSAAVRGDMYLKFVGPTADCSFGGGQRTWVGTVEIDGETYGWADFGIVFREYFDGRFAYFEEYWTIFRTEADHIEGPNDTDDLGALMSEACDPGLVLIDGHNIGWGWAPNGNALGRVEFIAEDGPFAHVGDGALMFWRGAVAEFNGPGGSPSDFEARLRIR